jgi:hypothetical protein
LPELARTSPRSPRPHTNRAPRPSQLAALLLPSPFRNDTSRGASAPGRLVASGAQDFGSPPRTAPASLCSLFLPPTRRRLQTVETPRTTEVMASSTPSSSATSSNAGADPNTTNLRPTSRSCPSFLSNGLRGRWGRWDVWKLRCQKGKPERTDDGGWETNGALTQVSARGHLTVRDVRLLPGHQRARSMPGLSGGDRWGLSGRVGALAESTVFVVLWWFLCRVGHRGQSKG